MTKKSNKYQLQQLQQRFAFNSSKKIIYKKATQGFFTTKKSYYKKYLKKYKIKRYFLFEKKN